LEIPGKKRQDWQKELSRLRRLSLAHLHAGVYRGGTKHKIGTALLGLAPLPRSDYPVEERDLELQGLHIMKRMIFVIGSLLVTQLFVASVWAMSLSFSWSDYQACSSASPAFTIFGAPSGTTKLAFRMVDKNVPSFKHGGGTIVYDGSHKISAGAFEYIGPCPPDGEHHRYEWTVQALDEAGNILATATATRAFPPW
jgi:hypothetical protein